MIATRRRGQASGLLVLAGGRVDPLQIYPHTDRRNLCLSLPSFFTTSGHLLSVFRTRSLIGLTTQWLRRSQLTHPNSYPGSNPAVHPVCPRLSLSSTPSRPIMALTQAMVTNLTSMTSMTPTYEAIVSIIASTQSGRAEMRRWHQ